MNTKLIAFLTTFFALSALAMTPPSFQEKQYMTPNNALINGGFENGTSRWTAYADAAGAAPVDCTGGSPVAGLLSTTTTNPLAGGITGTLVKDAANRQGQGISNSFSIDRADQAKPLSIEFDYNVISGTYADADLSVWIYNVTDGQVIQTAPSTISKVTSTSRWKGTFQTASASTSYRVCVHVSSVSASAYTLGFDNFKVSSVAASYGVPATDWVSYTPVMTNFANSTPTGKWRRVGDSMEVQLSITATGNASGSINVALPTGYTIDTNKIGSTASYNQSLGTFRAYVAAATPVNAVGSVQYVSSTTVAFVWTYANALSNTAPAAFANNDTITAHFNAPISGWSSNVVMSDNVIRSAPTVQTFTTGTAATYTKPPGVQYIRVRMVGGGGGGGGSADATANGGTSTGSTASTFACGSSTITANAGAGGAMGNSAVAAGGAAAALGTGWVGTSIAGGSGGEGTANNTGPVNLMIAGGSGGNSMFGGAGGGGVSAAGGAGAANSGSGGGGGGSAAGASNHFAGGGGGAGSSVDAMLGAPYLGSTCTYTVGAGGTAGAAGTNGFAGGLGPSGYIEVTEYYLMGPSIAQDATVKMIATSATTTLNSTSQTPVIFPTVVTDSHGKYNATTGEYTIPSAGAYAIDCTLSMNKTWQVGTYFSVMIMVDGVNKKHEFYSAQVAGAYAISKSSRLNSYPLKAGQVIRCDGTQGATGNTALSGGADTNTLEIVRVGAY
jgi:hypothetical protein